MKGLVRTLAILASLMLAIQTIRHTYVLWFAPRTSVLAQFDRPLANEIDSAKSLDELLARYTPLRQEVDRIRAEREAEQKAGAPFRPTSEMEDPFKSERQLHEAITTWEARDHTIRSLRYYWAIGFVFSLVGLALYGRNHWLGITLSTIGLSEMTYWTSPEFLSSFMGGNVEFDRLLIYKLILSVVASVVLAVTIWRYRVFRENAT